MRTFKTVPIDPDNDLAHMWALVATEEDGSEATVETYATRAEAEAARTVLQTEEMDEGH